MRAAAVVLAAGASTRFGGDKLAAILDGRPLIGHVVDAARAAGLDPIVVVVPPTSTLTGLDLGNVRRITNEHPEEGLSSSVRLGLRALFNDPVEAAVFLPADQPRVRTDVIERLVTAAAEHPDAGFVAPRYAADGSPNPVLARRTMWRLADELVGDRGFGPVLGSHPELIRWITVGGANPDIDTPDDLRRLTEPSEPPAVS